MLLFSHLLLDQFEKSIDTGATDPVVLLFDERNPGDHHRRCIGPLIISPWKLTYPMKIDGLEDDSFSFNMVPFQETNVYLPGTSGSNYQPSPAIFPTSSGLNRIAGCHTVSTMRDGSFVGNQAGIRVFKPLGPECCNHIHSRKLLGVKSWYHDMPGWRIQHICESTCIYPP